VAIRVLRSATTLRVRVTDFGGAAPMSAPTAPDIEAKLAGEQSPRGWGLFLIENMVDDAELTTDGERRTLDLVMHLEEAADAGA
jgi:anti-sigma regulatory factor (Ser/Thr protein kinase)